MNAPKPWPKAIDYFVALASIVAASSSLYNFAFFSPVILITSGWRRILLSVFLAAALVLWAFRPRGRR